MLPCGLHVVKCDATRNISICVARQLRKWSESGGTYEQRDFGRSFCDLFAVGERHGFEIKSERTKNRLSADWAHAGPLSRRVILESCAEAIRGVRGLRGSRLVNNSTEPTSEVACGTVHCMEISVQREPTTDELLSAPRGSCRTRM